MTIDNMNPEDDSFILEEVKKIIDPKFMYLLRNDLYVEFLEDIVRKTMTYGNECCISVPKELFDELFKGRSVEELINAGLMPEYYKKLTKLKKNERN